MKFIERFSRKPAPQTVPADPGAAPLLMALEPRIMFDASVGVVAQEAAQATAETAKDSTSTQDQASKAPATADTSSATTQQRHEVVFVDGQLNNVQDLLSGLSANAEVVVLDPSKDGLQQMADYLKGRENLDAIQLLSHGADGTMQAGTVWLSEANLAEHRAALESIGAALKADGDLMLYGCRVGEGDKGQSFIDELASITGADVAASSDDTGGTAQGGNWVLERTSGSIETASLGAQLSGYQGLMVAAFTGGTDASSPSPGALAYINRLVVGDFNNDGRDDILYQSSDNLWRFAAGNANGTFTISAQSASPFAGLTLADNATSGNLYYVGDFDGDGDDDLLYAAPSSATHTLYRNDNGSFTALAQGLTGFTGGTNGQRLIVGDFNGDGADDILFQVASTGSAWKYALNNGSGSFTEMDQSASPFAGLSLLENNVFGYRVVDFDGDGDLDIYAGLNAATGKFYRNDGATFSDQTASLTNLPTLPNSQKLLLGDFDGDGDADMFFQNGADGTAWRYFRNDNGTFVELAQSASPFAGLSMLNYSRQNYRLGDFDGDGDYDVFGAVATGAGSTYLMSGAPPKLVSATPADNSNNVSPTANIVLTFSESVSKGAGNIYIVRTSDNQIVQTIDVTSGAVTGSGTTWTIDPPANLAQGEAYAIRIDTKTFVDSDGVIYRGIQNNTTLNFVTSTSAAPVVANLNGDVVNYTEKSSGVLIDSGNNAVVTDADSANFNGGSVRVSVTGGAVTGEDVLSVLSLGTAAGQISVSGSNVLYGGVTIGSVTGGTGGNALVITLNASADAAAVSALVKSLQYSNSNTTTPNTGARTLSVTVTDETGTTSTASTVTVNILAVNDAPVVNVTSNNPTFTENGSAVAVFSGTSINTVETGQTVTQMTFSVSNLANGASEKLVIDGSEVTLTAGTSLTTLNNGISVSVSVSSGTANVTVTHAGLSTATAQTIINNITYRNDSNAPSGTSRTVTLTNVRDSGGTNNGGQEGTSPNVASVVTLVAVNDAPTLSGGSYVIPSTNENTTSGNVTVSTILAGVGYADADAAAASGIAVTGTVGRGTWQYSTDGTTWTAFGTVSTSSALLLGSSTQIRYIPDNVNGENVSITFLAWDRTSGFQSTNGVPNTGDTTANGSSTAYSTATANATLIVTSVNDAPVITPANPTMTGLTDSSTNNNGDAVSTLLGGVTDVDTGALKGIVINGLTATYGKWQFSTNNGTTWNDIGVVSDAGALLLRPADRVRFVPDGIHGETATITYRAWDQTSSQGYQGTTVNVNSNGGATSYSSTTDTASVVVTAVNDAPIVTGSGGSVGWTEGNNVTSTPVAVDSGIVITDPDGPSIASATVSLGGTYVLGEDTLGFTSNPATMGDISASWDAVNGLLTLTSAGGATQAQFQAALRSVTYTNGSDTPTTTTRTVSIKVNDGSLDSNVVTRNITITAVNDSPVISAPTNVTVTEDTLSPVTGIILSDVDSASGTLTLTVGAGNLSGTSGSGVTVGGTGTALTLTGTLTAINNYIAAGSLKYTPALNSNTSVTLGLSLDTASVSTDTRNLTLDITPVNDAPTISGPVSINVTEDVPKSMAGITFGDVDSGTGSVRVIFSVANGNGTFSATASSGVTVTNNGTNSITLEGTVTDINTLISNGRLTYLGALNATGVKTMSISINDNGNTGSGGALQVNANISLVIAAVNDAPVNNLPSAQTVFQDGSLVFNSANGNLITITDVDAGGNTVKLTLTSVNGQMTLGSIVGLSFSTGDGTNDTSMVFTGTLAAINAALNGLTFTPQPGYNGTGSITFESDDQGYSGSGGVKTDTDTLSITIAPINPKITGVVAAPGSDGAHKVGDTIDIVVQFDNAVIVDQTSGSPTLLLETGAIDRQAQYISGTGTTQLTFRYTVQVGDLSADLDYASTSALSLNGAVLQSAQGYAAILTLPTVGGASSLAGQQAIVVDGVAPSINNIVLPGDASYRLGQNLDFTVNFSEAVSVDATGGTPRIEVTLDTGGTVYAEYVSGSGTSALVFRLVIASGQQDSNGITVGNSIQLNGGSLRDLAGNDSAISLAPGNSSGILVDGIVPTVATVSVPGNGSYKAGDVLSFTVNASEAVFASGSPRLALDVGGITRYATLVAGSSSGSSLVFQYTVQAGDGDSDGISVASNLDLNGGSVKDAAGNDLNLALNSVGSTTAVLVDTGAPSVTGVTRTGGMISNGSSVSYDVTFSEDVSGVDISDFDIVFGGSVTGTLASVTRINGRAFSVVIDNISGAGTLTLALKNSGTGIVDAANNAVTGGLVGQTYVIDRIAPTVTSVGVPGNGTYVTGQNLDFTVHLSENVQLNTSNGTPHLEVLLDNGQTAWAEYVSGSGTNALVFRLTVATGQLDTNGISVGNNIQLNGATLRDSVGNDAQLGLNGLPPTDGVLVDAVAPSVATVTLPSPGAYNAGDVLRFIVNASETVVVDGGTPRLALNIGGVTRYAQYISGSGTSALVFEYTVDSTVNAPNGITLGANIDRSGATLRDAAGNAMNLALNSVGSGSAVIVDTNAPNFVSTDNVDITPTNAGSVRFSVTFNETVTGVDSSDFSLVLTGSANGRIASVTQVDGRTYIVTVDSLSGAGNLRLDLNASSTGITDVAGNPIVGGGQGSGYDIDRVAPSVTSVGVPPAGTYVAGAQLNFTVNTSEAVLVDSGDGNPRLAITLDNGRVVYADYLSSNTAGTTLTFRLNVTNGMAGNTTFSVGSSIDLNGATIRDAQGNDAQTGLNNVGSTSGILVDARAPRPSSIVVDGPVLPTDRSLSFTLTFDEAVSGVDASDFSVLGTSSASGSVQSVERIDAQIYRIVVGNLRGQGTLALSLNAQNSGIQDGAGNQLAVNLASQAQAWQTQDVGDLNYRLNPPQIASESLPNVVPPQVPTLVVSDSVSPLVPGSLFDVRTVGGDIQPLGTIFLGNASSAPSFIAQVFGSSDSGVGNGGGNGFLGFGGGNGGVFGSSTLSAVFSHDVPGVNEMSVFNGNQWRPADINQGMRGVFGAPTFGQQLQQINDADLRNVRELANALAQPAQIGQQA